MGSAGTDEGGSDLTGYELRIWDTASSQWVVEAILTEDDVSYADEGLTNVTTYYYILRAKNGEGDGPWTDPASAPTGNASPDVPELTAMATGTDEIRLTWEASSSNGTTGFESYVIERWNTDATAPGWSASIPVPGGTDSTLYIDRRQDETQDETMNPLAAGTTYYYRIRTNDNEDRVVDCSLCDHRRGCSGSARDGERGG